MTAEWRVLLAFLRRDVHTLRSYRLPLILESVAGLFSVVMFLYIAKLVDRADLSGIAGMERGYFGYVIIGLAVLQFVTSGLTSFNRRIAEEQVTGSLETLLTTPVSMRVLIIGSSAFDMMRALIGGAALFAMALIAGLDLAPVGLHTLAAVGLIAALFGFFAGLGILVAAYTIVFKRGASLLGLVSMGLGVLGGVYFPIELLPGPLEFLGRINPFRWGVDALRAALLDGQVNVAQILGLAAASLVLVPAAVAVFSRSVDIARRRGTLSTY